MADKQSRIFIGVLYPDSTSYEIEKVISRLEDTFTDLAYITHDLDLDDMGTVKKLHVHWCGKRSSPAPISTIANSIGVDENAIEFCRNWKYSLRYLIHADNPEKFQYSPDKVTATFPFTVVIEGKLEAFKARQIYNFINAHPTITPNALAQWCFEHELWSEYRRSFAIWCSLMREVQVENK